MMHVSKYQNEFEHVGLMDVDNGFSTSFNICIKTFVGYFRWHSVWFPIAIYPDETILDSIQRLRLFVVELGVHTVGLLAYRKPVGPLLAWLKNSHIGVQWLLTRPLECKIIYCKMLSPCGLPPLFDYAPSSTTQILYRTNIAWPHGGEMTFGRRYDNPTRYRVCSSKKGCTTIFLKKERHSYPSSPLMDPR